MAHQYRRSEKVPVSVEIRGIRRRACVSIQHMADKLSIPRGDIIAMENGLVPLDFDFAAAYLDALDLYNH